jgi:hypothetical protein
MKRIAIALTLTFGSALWLAAGPGPAQAAQRCRDAQGHFVRCPPAPASNTAMVAPPITTPTLAGPVPARRCQDARGHFASCANAGHTATSAALPAGITRDHNGRCHGARGRFVVCPH